MNVEHVRCGDCHQHYRSDTNLLTGNPMWMPPKKKRGGCTHPFASAQAFIAEAWFAMPYTEGDEPVSEVTGDE